MGHPIQLFSDSRSSNRKVGSLIVHAHTCLTCGAAYDGDRCWTCLAREEDVAEEFKVFLLVGGLGWMGIMLAVVDVYPPLQTKPLYGLPGAVGQILVLFIPMLVFFALRNQLSRYALLIRIMLLFAG